MPTPEKQLFKFEINKETAEHNWKILSKFSDLGEALKSQEKTALGYGSEFRSTILLEKIFKYHPLWNRLQNILKNGVEFPL